MSLRLAFAFVLALGAPAVVIAAPAGAPVVPPADAAAAVAPLLRQYEGLPSADTFRAVTPDPVAALQALYADPKQPEWVRLRVLDALARFPEPAAQVFLEARLDDGAARPTAPREAHAAAAVYLRTFPKAATARLPALLAHPDAAFRVTVVRIALEAEALELRTAVAAWLHATRDPAVQGALGPATPVLR
jgi:hypothetical protein